MNRPTFDKTLAILVCTMAIGSFAVQPAAQAQPIFPPAHVAAEARFAAPREAMPVPVPVPAATPATPWYRPGQPAATLPGTRFALAADTGPWYRTVR